MGMLRKVLEFVLLGSAALFGVLALMVVIDWSPLKSGDVASWVQAFGSIAAIIGAYFVGERQAAAVHESELKLRRAEVRRKNGSILAICNAALAQASEIAGIYKDKIPNMVLFHLAYSDKLMQDTISALEAIPVHDCGSFDAVAAFMRLKNSLIYLRRQLDKDLDLYDKRDTVDEERYFRNRRDVASVILTNCRLIQRYYGELEKAFDEQVAAG